MPVHRYDEQFKPVKATADGRFIGEGVYKPLVAPMLFDAAQRRLATFVLKGDGGHGLWIAALFLFLPFGVALPFFADVRIAKPVKAAKIPTCHSQIQESTTA